MIDGLTEDYDRLDVATSEVVRSITNLAATMKVLESADPHATEVCLESTEATFDALVVVLEGLAQALEASAAGDLPRERLESFIDEREAPPEPIDPEQQPEQSPDDPFERVSPMRRLSAPYSVLLNLERDLYADRIRRPYRLRQLKRLWGDLGRIGSSHPSDGLTARLGRLTDFVREALDGRQAGAPWSDDDIEEVRQLAARTADIIDWDEEEVGRREREDWVDRVRDWVETAEEEPESAAHMTEMLTRFLTDMPSQKKPDVRMLLERITEIETVPTHLRKKAAAPLDE